MTSIKSKARWLTLASVLTLTAGCRQTDGFSIDISAVGAAPFCKVIEGLDLRPSRKDTAPTQRTFYLLQTAQADCWKAK
jgi:hypothetical protein